MAKVQGMNKLVDNVIAEAEKEIQEEITKAAKKELKDLLRRKIQAVQVLKNIEREIRETKLKIGHELGE